jgi:integrase/recombinase XerD
MSNILPSLIERFFTQRLVRQRNASLHTVAAYRDTFRLLLKFAHRRIGKQPSALSLSDLDANLVVAFLDHLADDRAASAATYNLRLTGIRAFFRFLAFEEPAYSGQIQRVLAIPGKLSAKREVSYLLRKEIEAILAAPDRSTWLGRRDHALLLMTVQTGLRLSEIVSLDGALFSSAPGRMFVAWARDVRNGRRR